MFLHHRVFILSPKLHLETRPDTGCSIDDVTLPEFEFFFLLYKKYKQIHWLHRVINRATRFSAICVD